MHSPDHLSPDLIYFYSRLNKSYLSHFQTDTWRMRYPNHLALWSSQLGSELIYQYHIHLGTTLRIRIIHLSSIEKKSRKWLPLWMGGGETSIFDQKQKFLNIYLQGTSWLQELTRMLKHAENICPPNKYSPGLNQCHLKKIMGEWKMPLIKTFILNLYATIVGLLVELLNCSYAFDNMNVEWVMVRLLLIVTVWVPNAHKGNSYVRDEWPPNPPTPAQQISLLIQSIKVHYLAKSCSSFLSQISFCRDDNTLALDHKELLDEYVP